MAGILKRFKDIMAENINALLDKAEDPEKMIDQYLRDMESDLGNVKAETASIMAEATRTKRELDQTDEDIARMQAYAEKALLAGSEEDAKKFLEKKGQLSEVREAQAKVAEAAAVNAERMREMHDKLAGDIAKLNERKAAIKAKVAAAKTQEKINELNEKVNSIDVNDYSSTFDRMEEKAEKMLDEANAMAELNDRKEADKSVDELIEKYDAKGAVDVDSELTALKDKLGLL